MLICVLVVVGLVLVAWYAVAQAWAASLAKHEPELHESALRTRLGWSCPRCGHTYAPACKAEKCGGALVWVHRGTRINCARCHRHFIAHPMLFRQTPRPRWVRCPQCRWSGVVKSWKVS